MGRLLTLVAAIEQRRAGAVGLPAGYACGPARPDDAKALGRLYFAAYEPGVAGETVAEAVADVRATFDGAYGEFWPAGSSVVRHQDVPVAAVLAVRRVPWDDTPDCPFVVELFTDRAHRRRGLARALLVGCLAAARAAGEPALALRVDAENAAARALYAALGFRPWQANGGAGAAEDGFTIVRP
jgi:GNAT superfamily N-acetyltransferase